MSETILYIDDDPQLGDQVEAMLLRAGYRLVHAADAEAALHVAREKRPAMVLAEVLLAGCDGFALLEQIDDLEPGDPLPIVVLTRGERTPSLYGRAIELGVEDFLCKPVTRAQVLEAVLEYARSPEPDTPTRESRAPSIGSFTGRLADEPMPGLLGRLHRAGASGVLTLRSGSEVRALQLRNGSPVQVSRHRNIESVADFLLKTKRIDSQQYEMLVDQLMAKLAGPREILLGMDALGEEELEKATHEQARSVLNGMLRWPSGEFDFVAKGRLEVADSLELVCDPAEAVLTALRHLDTEIVRNVLDRKSGLYVSSSASTPDGLVAFGLTTNQRQEVASLGGERTLAEVLASSRLDQETLYGLYAIGAIEFQEQPVIVLDLEFKPVELDEGDLDIDPEDALMAPDLSRQVLPKRRVVDDGTTESTIHAIAERLEGGDDFVLFDIDETSSNSEVRQAYDRLLASLRPEGIPPELDELHALARKLRERLERAYDRVRNADTRAAFAGLRKKKVGKPEAPSEPEEQPDGSRAVEAESWFRTGDGHLSHKEYEQAVEAFGMAVHCDPDQGDYSAHLGYALYRTNPDSTIIRREALEHVAKGVKLAPENEKPLLFLARIFRETGDAAMAAKVLSRALRISPDAPALVQEMCLINGSTKQQKKGLLARLRRR